MYRLATKRDLVRDGVRRITAGTRLHQRAHHGLLMGDGGGGGGGTDPDFASVVALLHFDGADGSTTFTDQKGHAFGVTVGTPTISTAESKFGGASQLYASGSQVACSNHADFTFPQVWTFEFWIRPTVKTGYSGGLFEWNRGGFYLAGIHATNGDMTIFVEFGTLVLTIPSASWPVNSWHHIAFTRNSGGTVTAWVNGASVTSGSNSGTSSGNGFISIGRGSLTSNALTGNMDDLRVTSGVCRYTGAFTPPTAAFPDA